MFRSIMVPMADPANEHAALDVGVRIARASGARLHVVHVQEARSTAKRVIEADELYRAAGWASDELDESVSFHVLERAAGAPHTLAVADALEAYARANHVDLIVMLRRRHSLNRLLFGSIGEHLLLSQERPILFVPSRENAVPKRGFRILVALDGSAQGEAALNDAVELARALKGTVTLTRVLAPITAPTGVAPADVDALVEEEGEFGESAARSYLDGIAARIEASGVKVRRYTVPGEQVSPAVRKTASYERVHAVALAPRVSEGTMQFAANSVTESFLHRTETALLARRRSNGTG